MYKMRTFRNKIVLFSCCLITLLLYFEQPLTAQRVITGVVTDAANNETLPGANIAIKGTSRGTSTDADGRYSLRVEPTDSILQFSFAGFTTFELRLTDNNTINVALEVADFMLDDVVVIGYGSVRKSDLTGSVSSVKSEDIVKFTGYNAEQALSGKVAGVQVVTTSGAPGAASTVRIRGVGTFNNSAPIYVVDGVILDDISFLNANDISSMEVLKDASATAIYGSRGANGVIMVTTKMGQKGQKTRVSLSSEVGIQQLERSIDLLDGRQFAAISNEIRPGSYNNIDAVPNTDWQNLIFESAPMTSSQISITGAGDKSEFYIGIGLFQQEGIVPNSSFERLTLKLNNNYQISSKIKVGSNLTFAPYRQEVAPNVTFSAYRAQPVLDPFYSDGSFGVVLNVGNPLADLAFANNQNSGLRMVGNLFAEAELIENFTFRTSFGGDAALNRGRSFTPAYTIFNPDGTESQQLNLFSDLFKGTGENSTWLWENTLNFTSFKKGHGLNMLVGYTAQQTRSESFRLTGQNVIRDGSDFWYIEPQYIIDESNNINTLNSIFNGVDPNQFYNMMSFLGRANYSYNEKYLLTLTVRRDGSSKFGQDNRWGTFPSAAVGWNLDKEAFFQKFDNISDLKVRASWGIIGNDRISYFDRFARVQSGLNAIFGNPDTPFPAATFGRAGNPDLQWETTTQTDIGLEMGFFKGKLTTEFDFYNRLTSDILVDLSTPGHLGNGQGQRVRFNAAEVLNRGIEASINWADNIKDFSYNIGLVATTVQNEVQSIGGTSGVDSVLIGGFLANGQPVTLSRVGRPIGAFYGYRTDGIFQNAAELAAYPHSSQAGVGDLRFVDTNGDGRITGDDRVYLGSPIPDFIFGVNFSANYKQFDLSLSLQGQTGNEIFNGKNVVRPDPYNFEAHVWDRWTGEGTSDTEPRPSFGGYNFLPSDRFIHDGSFLRLRELVIGYNLPVTLAEKLNLSQARVYLKGNNILTWTKYTGYTPEIGSFDVLSNGIDSGVYPIASVYAFGINVSF
jgi:TonB-linked SusC/RagA family outer membrane protein